MFVRSSPIPHSLGHSTQVSNAVHEDNAAVTMWGFFVSIEKTSAFL